MSTVVCPDCQGAKAGFGIACSDRGCRPIERACDFCGGEGRVSPEANERWQKGRAARDARVKQRLSLFEEAAILGIAPEVLNDIDERVDWHNIVVFGKAAESCKEYLKQGRQVYVEGRLRTREYEARNNGGKRQRTEIIAQRVQFLGTPPADAKSAEVNGGEAATDEAPF